MKHRSGKQCRERYKNHLKSDIKKGDWSLEEDAIVESGKIEHGGKWSQIAKFLPGRSDNSVKNRWHLLQRNKSEKAQEKRKKRELRMIVEEQELEEKRLKKVSLLEKKKKKEEREQKQRTSRGSLDSGMTSHSTSFINDETSNSTSFINESETSHSTSFINESDFSPVEKEKSSGTTHENPYSNTKPESDFVEKGFINLYLGSGSTDSWAMLDEDKAGTDVEKVNKQHNLNPIYMKPQRCKLI